MIIETERYFLEPSLVDLLTEIASKYESNPPIIDIIDNIILAKNELLLNDTNTEESSLEDIFNLLGTYNGPKAIIIHWAEIDRNEQLQKIILRITKNPDKPNLYLIQIVRQGEFQEEVIIEHLNITKDESGDINSDELKNSEPDTNLQNTFLNINKPRFEVYLETNEGRHKPDNTSPLPIERDSAMNLTPPKTDISYWLLSIIENNPQLLKWLQMLQKTTEDFHRTWDRNTTSIIEQVSREYNITIPLAALVLRLSKLLSINGEDIIRFIRNTKNNNPDEIIFKLPFRDKKTDIILTTWHPTNRFGRKAISILSFLANIAGNPVPNVNIVYKSKYIPIHWIPGLPQILREQLSNHSDEIDTPPLKIYPIDTNGGRRVTIYIPNPNETEFVKQHYWDIVRENNRVKILVWRNRGGLRTKVRQIEILDIEDNNILEALKKSVVLFTLSEKQLNEIALALE